MKKLFIFLIFISLFAFGKEEIKPKEKKPVVTEKKETKKTTTPVQKTGTLSISADETGELYIDGDFVRYIGKSAQNIVLNAGSKNITVYFNNYTYKGSSTISLGKTTSLYIKKSGIDAAPYKDSGNSDTLVLYHNEQNKKTGEDLTSDKETFLSFGYINKGTETAKKIVRKISLKENGNWKELNPNYGEDFTPGWSFTSSFSLGKLKTGQYSIKIVVDPDNEIWETDESNNSYERTFEVKEPKKDPAYLSYAYVEGGTFTMGDTFGDGYYNEKPIHSVTLDSFYMSKYEVTQKDYEELIGYITYNGNLGDNYSVDMVTWYDAVMYANKLSEKEGLKPYYNISSVTKERNWITNATVTIAGGKGYRLPTEAEWEYAARGGKQTKGYKYSGSNNVDEVAWYSSNSNDTQIVGQKKANELGIYDMSGNVMEWCWDWYGTYSSSSQTNPMGPTSGTSRVARSGGYWMPPKAVTISDREMKSPNIGNQPIGFRLVRSY